MNGAWHPHADRILERISRERIRALFHFTSIENLALIKSMNALCSKHVLQNAGRWPPPEPGGNDLSHNLDRFNNNWDKLSLNFTPHTPMAYHKKQASHLCYFALDVSVAARAGVVFTDTNAANTGSQRRGDGLTGLNLVNFDAVRSHPRPWDRDGWVRPVQAEILVPGTIALDHVLEIGFVSQASLEEAQRVWGNPSNASFTIQPQYYSDTPSSVSLNFPYVESILLTSREVNKSTTDQHYLAESRFSRARCQTITLLANINATAGVKAKVTWWPAGLEQIEEFETTTRYWHWPSVPIHRLPNGPCSVEYRLNGVRWGTLPFQVVA